MTVVADHSPTAEELQEVRDLVTQKVGEAGGPDLLDKGTLDKVATDEEYVAKFYRHTRDNPGSTVGEAATMIMNTAKWRHEFGAGDVVEASFNETILEKGTLFSRNRDKDGKKLLIFCVGKHVKGAEKMEDMKKFFVYQLERLGREEAGDQFTIMFDCQGAGLKNMDMEFVQFIIGTMGDYYPDPLNYILVFEMPWVLNAAFKIIKAWLPPAAVKKIKFLTKSNMGEYVDTDNRLESWGGSDPWEYKWESEPSSVSATGIVNGQKENTKYEDARDESGRKKTVTFAGSHSVSSSNSVESLNSSVSGSSSQTGGQQDILRLSPGQEVVFAPSSSGDLMGKVTIQNASTRVVGYKIKTTSPEKYRVRPSTGSLAPAASSLVEIHVVGAGDSGMGGLVRDKFLITAVFLEREDLSPAQLTEAMKLSTPDGQYRLRCQVAAEQGLGPGGPSPPPPQSTGGVKGVQQAGGVEDSTRQVASILKQVNKLSDAQQRLEGQVRLVLQVELVLVGLVVLLIVIALFYNEQAADFLRSSDQLDPPEGSPVSMQEL